MEGNGFATALNANEATQEAAALSVSDLHDMYQIYAHNLLKLIDGVRDLELEISKPAGPFTPAQQKDLNERVSSQLGIVKLICAHFSFASAEKQVRHIEETGKDGKLIGGDVMARELAELRRRIVEDLEDHVYLCIPRETAFRFFKRVKGTHGLLPKVASELMDASIVNRFPSTSDDIELACRCLLCDSYTACVFHLMRIVEVGVLRVARLAGNSDPKPSWGSALGLVEKLVLRTKFQDLDPAIQPHRPLLEELLPQMQAIQRAWRNKIIHVGDKLIPIEPISESTASEILVTVEAFMRKLAASLPSDI
jgi:hypothetical protein